MRPALPRTALSVLVLVVLAACNRPSPPEAASAPETAPAPAATTAPAAPAAAPVAKRAARRITPDEIAQIEASGRTGLWSEVMEVCAGAKPVRTTLTWNVKPSGAERVVVYVVDRKGVERNFGQGGPIGLKETGPWLRSGTVFKVRAAGTKEELGNLVIGEKQCQE